MIICGICLGLGIILWITRKKKFTKVHKQMLGVLMISGAIGFVYGVGTYGEAVLFKGHMLQRNKYGEGAYEETLRLQIEGFDDEANYKVTVPEQRLTKQEEQQYLEAAVHEIQLDFPGENESVNCIREKVSVRESYQEGIVSAAWSFDDYQIINSEGEVSAVDVPEDGKLVKATVVLNCEDTERIEEFYFRVFPVQRDAMEEIFWQLGRAVENQGTEEAKEYLELPQMIEGHRLAWSEQADKTPEKILLFGIVIAVFVPLLEESRRREDEKKREKLLELEYPDVVSKIALLLGAGMTLQGAIRKIALNYSEKKEQGSAEKQPAYEELMITCHEIENGMGESMSYERFGERCKRAEYRKLGNLLAQNLRKGSNGILVLLEQEAERAFEERKSAARRYGEEAGTKLLFPMMLMLGLVMVVLLVPAVLAFQL